MPMAIVTLLFSVLQVILIEGLDVIRVVSDDNEELRVVSDIREPESVANVSSVFSWNSVR
jgi:recombinational DNA repair protein RecT